ncbi:MAG: hypothetical protein U9Q07_11365, partial [Planctomycetota bacterium]|nr:hypothetical protein [Planctomycetota bacterium]
GLGTQEMRFYFRAFVIVLAGLLYVLIVSPLLVILGEATGIPHRIQGQMMLGLAFGFPVALYYYLEKRRDRNRALAAKLLGFSLLEQHDTDDLGRSLNALPTFRNNIEATISNHFRTSLDHVKVSIFDYLYLTVPRMPWWAWFPLMFRPAPCVPAMRWQTVVLSTSSDLTFPEFSLHLRSEVRKEGRIRADIGDEVLMPPEFFKKYSLRGFDKERIHAFFSPEIVSYYLRNDGLHTEAVGTSLVVYRPGRLVAVDDMKPFVGEVNCLLNLFRAAVSEN